MAAFPRREFLLVRTRVLYPGPLSRVWLAFLVVFAALICAGCPPKVARIKVSSEDIIRSNEASKEGDVAFARKDFYAALIKYLEAGRLNPNNEFIFNRVGITYSQLHYYQEASVAFQRSMALNPKYPYSVNNLGSVYFALKDLKKAEKYFRKAVRMKEDEPSFHMNLGSLYFERKKFDLAMAAWQRGLTLDPEIFTKNSSVSLIGGSSPSKERSYYLARLFASAGNVTRAIESLQQAFTDGWSDIAAIEKQPDFDRIRKDERFVEFLKNLEVLIRLRESGESGDSQGVALEKRAPDGGVQKPQ